MQRPERREPRRSSSGACLGEGVRWARDRKSVLAMRLSKTHRLRRHFLVSFARSYGGVVYREAVAQKADWYITRVQQLIDALESKSSA